MSATMDSAKLSTYFDNAPVVAIPGRTFPVSDYYIEDIIEMTRYSADDEYVKKTDPSSIKVGWSCVDN